MNLKEMRIAREIIYQGKIINVYRDDALLPDGRACKREVVEHSGGAAVLCVYEGKVALVKQYRYVYGEELYEIPAGKLNPGEDPALAAARELSEETGFTAKKLELVNVMYPTPGYTNEKIYIYHAIGVEKGESHLDDGEFLNVEYFPVEGVLKMIESGQIKDGKTIIAVLRCLK